MWISQKKIRKKEEGSRRTKTNVKRGEKTNKTRGETNTIVTIYKSWPNILLFTLKTLRKKYFFRPTVPCWLDTLV